MIQDLSLLKELIYIRLVEEAIAKRYSDQQMRCPVHLSIGQEAVPVGITNCLTDADHVVSAHRSHAHYLAKGGCLDKMLGELHGKASGCARGKGGSMHLIDHNVNFTAAVPIVGSSISIGTGVAFGLSLKGMKNIKVVVYFGDGATEQGVFAESLDFASLHNLPVIFVCENNLYSVYTNLEKRQAKQRNIHTIANGHGVKSWKANGNDVLEVKKTCLEAIDYLEGMHAPVLLEFDTYRWLEHCGPNWDDDLGYRPAGELQSWLEFCPIEILSKKIISQDANALAQITQFKLQTESKIQDAFERAIAAPFPNASELYEDVFA